MVHGGGVMGLLPEITAEVIFRGGQSWIAVLSPWLQILCLLVEQPVPSIPGDIQTNVHRKVIKLHFGMD